MPDRHFPVRPNLEQLKHQAKDLLRADPSLGKLAHAQHALARSYGLPSWPRLVLACRMTDAIWRDDVEAVLYTMGARPDAESVEGPCEIQCGAGLAYLVSPGCELTVSHVALVLQTYSRSPQGKHHGPGNHPHCGFQRH